MALFEKKRSVLGLDIGSSSIKAIEVVQDKGRNRIVGFGQVEVPAPDHRADALSDLLKHCGFKTKKAVTAVSGKSVIVRFLNMVEIPQENLKSAIQFEADRYIPFDINEVVLDCHRVLDAPGLNANEMKLLLVAVKKDVVNEQIKLLQSVGMTPTVIDVDAFALGNCFAMGGPSYEMAAGKVVALVDIGASKTVVNIVCGHESYFTREVYLGGGDFTDALAKRFGVELFEAEQLKRQPGNRESEIGEAIVPALEDLGNEVHLSFDYYENQADQKVEEVFLSGGASRIKGIEEVFERIFERRTIAWNPVEGFELEEGAFNHEALLHCATAMGIAAGLALRTA